MKKIIVLLLALSCVLTFAGCSQTNSESEVESTEGESLNDVLQFFADKYDMTFTLWGPEGHDLYAFHIYDDHAERECHILMPENTDDIAEYHNNLLWEVVDNDLIIMGEWQETFKIDISAETATSTATGKVYQMYKIDRGDEQTPPTLDCKTLEASCANGFIDPSKVSVLGGEWAYTADPTKFVALATVQYTNKDDEYETADFLMQGVFGGEIELFHCLNDHSPYTRANGLKEFGAVDDQRFPLK